MSIKRTSNKETLFKNCLALTLLVGILVIAISLILLLFVVDSSYDASLICFGWIGNFLLMWGLYIFNKLVNNRINQYSIFYLCYFIFSYGQLMLFSFGIEYQKFPVLRIFPEADIIKYCMFFCISTCFFLLGALLAIKKDIRYKENLNVQKEYSNTLLMSMKIVAWTLFLISAPVYFKDLLSNASMSITYGYNEIYAESNSSSLSNIISSLSMWYVTSLYLLLSSYRQSKFARYSITLLIGITIIFVLIVGARSRAVALLLSYIFLWNTVVREISTRNKINILIGLFLFLTILPIIQMYRGTSGKSLESFLDIIIVMYDNNKFVEIIGELGSSMQVWLRVYNIVPSVYPLHLGESYLASILACIPSLLMGGYSFTEKAQLSGWLQSSANMSYGPGFSMHGEAYYNFGWLGIPFMLIIGWTFFKFLSNSWINGKAHSLKNTFSAIALFAFITSARGSMYLSIRTELYMILIPLFAIILLNNTLMRDRGQ